VKNSLAARGYAARAVIEIRGPGISGRENGMLKFLDNFAALLEDEEALICDICGQEASIFQEEGNFCLDCWQVRTEPKI